MSRKNKTGTLGNVGSHSQPFTLSKDICQTFEKAPDDCT